MGTLIDTSVLIAVERGELALEAIADSEEEIALAAVTASELLHGVYRAQTPTQRNRDRRRLWHGHTRRTELFEDSGAAGAIALSKMSG